MNAAALTTSEPSEVREFALGRFELFRIGSMEIGRAVYQPGWRWTDHVAPIAGTDLCDVAHVGFVLAGAAGVRMADGRELVLQAGEFFEIGPGHDSWVIGEQDYVSLHLAGGGTYAAREDETGRAGRDHDFPDLRSASALMRLIGLDFEEPSGNHVVGQFTADASHHQPWGIVHGGVYSTVIETAATTGGYLAVRDRGQRAIGVTNLTHFVRPHARGRLNVVAKAVHQGRSSQLWRAEIVRPGDGRLIAVGDVRLQNIAPEPVDASGPPAAAGRS